MARLVPGRDAELDELRGTASCWIQCGTTIQAIHKFRRVAGNHLRKCIVILNPSWFRSNCNFCPLDFHVSRFLCHHTSNRKSETYQVFKIAISSPCNLKILQFPTCPKYICAQDTEESCQQFFIRNFFITQCALQVEEDFLPKKRESTFSHACVSNL